MKNKRILVIGIALVLFALVCGVVFAATNTDGVIWAVIKGKSPRISQSHNSYVELYNSNNYAVKVKVVIDNKVLPEQIISLAAGETKHYAAQSCYVSWVKKN